MAFENPCIIIQLGIKLIIKPTNALWLLGEPVNP